MNLRAELLTVSGSSMAVGDIFTSKKLLPDGGRTKAINPKPGDTGWMFKGNNAEGKPIFQGMIFDKGGAARRTREEGGAIFSELPGWVTLAEQVLRKEGRSRYWQKAKGPADWAFRHKRLRVFEWRGIGMYGSGDGIPLHPHAHA
jgi:hypothetical protein